MNIKACFVFETIHSLSLAGFDVLICTMDIKNYDYSHIIILLALIYIVHLTTVADADNLIE